MVPLDFRDIYKRVFDFTVKQDDYNKWLARQPKKFDAKAIDDFLIERKVRPANLREAIDKIWIYPADALKRKDVPPSLQPIDVQLIPDHFADWGS